jgi:thiol-disulfide isomerase/thioredoxin
MGLNDVFIFSFVSGSIHDALNSSLHIYSLSGWSGTVRLTAHPVFLVAQPASVHCRVAEYGIRAIPTLLIFHNGQVADQIVGARSKRDFKASLDRVAV